MEGTRELAVGWEMQRSVPRTGGCWGLCLSRAREPRMDLEGKGGGLFGSTFEMPTLAQRGRSHRGCVRLPLRAEAGAGHVQNSSTWGGCGFKASERGQGHVEEESGPHRSGCPSLGGPPAHGAACYPGFAGSLGPPAGRNCCSRFQLLLPRACWRTPSSVIFFRVAVVRQ